MKGNNRLSYIKNKAELHFARLMELRGKQLVFHPCVKFGNESILPDFFCVEDETYYEIIGTRSAFNNKKRKIQRATNCGLNIRIVNGYGWDYKPRSYTKRQEEMNKLDREARQKIIREKGFKQADVARLAGIRPRRYACQILSDMLADRRRGEKWRSRVAEILGMSVEQFWGNGAEGEACDQPKEHPEDLIQS